MKSRARLRENITALAVLQLLTYAAPLLTVPYLVRVLDPAQFGLLSFAQGLVLYFSVVTDFGFDFSATRAIAARRHEPGAVARIFWSTLCAKTILMFGSAVALGLLVAFTPQLRETPGLFAATFLYVIGTAFFPVWLFQGLELMKLGALVFGTARLLTVPALFLLVRHPQDYVKAAAIQASVEMTASLLAAPIVWKRIKVGWVRPSASDIAETFRQGWPLFLSGSALYLCSSSTPVILGFVSDKTQVGYFSAADKLIRAATSLLNPVSQALYPHITARKVESTSSALQLIRRSFISIGLLSLGASVLIFVLAGPLSRLLLGSEFGESAHVLQWLSPLPLLVGLMNVLGTQTMLVFDMDRNMSQIMLAGAAAGIPLTVALSFLFGALGAAIATLILTALMVLAMFVTLRLRGLTVWRRSGQRNSALLITPVAERAEF
jgi:polysaccharide transporter, PST family